MSGPLYSVAALPDLICAPLLAQSSDRIVLTMPPPGSPASLNIDHLLEGGVTAAFIASLDYARNASGLLLSPALSVASAGPTGVLRICLRTSSRSIKTLAVGAASASDVVLARIVLSEQFDQEITIVPRSGNIEESLARADAVLVSGDESLRLDWKGPLLDLADEWYDMTELPFLHTACAAKESAFDGALDSALEAMAGRSDDEQIAALDGALLRLGIQRGALGEEFSHLVYGMTDEVREGMGEFFRYAFYLGILPDIPDINLYRPA